MSASEWAETVVKDVCESVVDCVNKTAPVVSYETPYKMIRTTNVKKGVVNLAGARYVEKEVFDKWTRRAVPKTGDVILTREAPLGDVGMITTPNENIFLGQRLMQYRAAPEKLDSKFLLYALQESFMQGQIKAGGSGSTVEHIRVGDAENLKIRLPAMSTQKELGALLYSYDNLIENNNRRIAILEDMAQSLYREWFVKFRFPGHDQLSGKAIGTAEGSPEGASTKDGETERCQFKAAPLGQIPEGWEVIELGEDITIKKGKNITQKTIVEGDVPVVAGGLKPAYYHNQANTNFPVVTVSASGANAGYVNIYYGAVWASDCSFIDSGVSPYVYFYYLLLKDRQYEITRMQTGAAQPHVYPRDLMRLEISNAPSELLMTFNQKVTPIFNLIRNLTTQNVNLINQREILLPKLISGKIDLEEECSG